MGHNRKGKLKRQKRKIIHYIRDEAEPDTVVAIVEKRCHRDPRALLQPIDKQGRTVFDLLAEHSQEHVIRRVLVGAMELEASLNDVMSRLLVIAGHRGHLQLLCDCASKKWGWAQRALHRGSARFASQMLTVVQTLHSLLNNTDSITRVLSYLYAFPAPAAPTATSDSYSSRWPKFTSADFDLLCPMDIFGKICTDRQMMQALITSVAQLPSHIFPLNIQQEISQTCSTNGSLQFYESVRQSFLPLRILCKLVSRGFTTLMIHLLLDTHTRFTQTQWRKVVSVRSIDDITALHIACIFGRAEFAVKVLHPRGAGLCGSMEPSPLLMQSLYRMVNRPCVGGDTPFLLACAHGHHLLVEVLLDWDLVDMYRSNVRSETALILAAQYHHADVVTVLQQFLESRVLGIHNNEGTNDDNHEDDRDDDVDVDESSEAAANVPAVVEDKMIQDDQSHHCGITATTLLPTARANQEEHWLAWTKGNPGGIDNDEKENPPLQRALGFIQQIDVDGLAALDYAQRSGNTAIATALLATIGHMSQ